MDQGQGPSCNIISAALRRAANCRARRGGDSHLCDLQSLLQQCLGRSSIFVLHFVVGNAWRLLWYISLATIWQMPAVKNPNHNNETDILWGEFRQQLLLNEINFFIINRDLSVGVLKQAPCPFRTWIVSSSLGLIVSCHAADGRRRGLNWEM